MNKSLRRVGVLLLAVVAIATAGCTTTEGGSATAATGAARSSAPVAVTTAPTSSPVAGTTVTRPTVTRPTVAAPTVAAPTVTRTSVTTPTVTRTSVTRTSAPGTPRTGAATTTTATPARPAGAFPLCPSVAPSDNAGIVRCLRVSVSDFWSGELNRVVDQPVVVNPTTSQVPADCRPGLVTAPAFTCKLNDTVYINKGLITLVTTEFGAKDVPYALASVVSHEIGHVVQAAVRQPGYNQTGTSDSISQQIEQQADCLSGVWAHAESSRGKLDAAVFVSVADSLIESVSSNPEIATHGTPPQRAAAVAKGLRNGRPQDCSLATFS